MTLFDKFVNLVGYFTILVLFLVLLGVGSALTLIALGVCTVGYFPVTFVGWIADRIGK